MLEGWKLRVEKGKFQEVRAVHRKTTNGDGGGERVEVFRKACYPLAFSQEMEYRL